MNVEIGAEAALFPEKEYINGIFVTVHPTSILLLFFVLYLLLSSLCGLAQQVAVPRDPRSRSHCL